MNTNEPQNNAFHKIAIGDFAGGIAALSELPEWKDESTHLQGPFDLRFPGVSGWGESIFLASLLKRTSSRYAKSVVIYAPPKAFSCLSKEDCFEVRKLDEGQPRPNGARSPLSILKAAITGDLLDQPFQPMFESFISNTESTSVGFAWRSRGAEKKIPPDNFVKHPEFEQGDPVCLQWDIKEHECEELHARFGDDIKFLNQKQLAARDQTKVLEAIGKLSKMISISTTFVHLAGAMGVPVTLYAARREHQQWFWRLQQHYDFSFYPSVDVNIGGTGEGWWQMFDVFTGNS